MAERGRLELENLIENLRRSGNKRIEFRVKYFALVEPVVLMETGVHLVPPDTTKEGPQLVKGFVQLSSLDREEVIRALGQIEKTMSVLFLRLGVEKLEWSLAMIHAEVFDMTKITREDFAELDRILGCVSARFKNTKTRNMYYRALDTYRHACRARNPIDRFMFTALKSSQRYTIKRISIGSKEQSQREKNA